MRTRSGALRAKARGATNAICSARFTLARCRVQLGYMPIQIESVLPRELYPVLAVAPVPVWCYLDHLGHLLPHLWCPPGSAVATSRSVEPCERFYAVRPMMSHASA